MTSCALDFFSKIKVKKTFEKDGWNQEEKLNIKKNLKRREEKGIQDRIINVILSEP